MFIYVFFYKSFLLIVLMIAMISFILVLKLIHKLFPKTHRVKKVEEICNAITFWNMPIRFAQLVIMDLFISALTTI